LNRGSGQDARSLHTKVTPESTPSAAPGSGAKWENGIGSPGSSYHCHFPEFQVHSLSIQGRLLRDAMVRRTLAAHERALDAESEKVEK